MALPIPYLGREGWEPDARPLNVSRSLSACRQATRFASTSVGSVGFKANRRGPPPDRPPLSVGFETLAEDAEARGTVRKAVPTALLFA